MSVEVKGSRATQKVYRLRRRRLGYQDNIKSFSIAREAGFYVLQFHCRRIQKFRVGVSGLVNIARELFSVLSDSEWQEINNLTAAENNRRLNAGLAKVAELREEVLELSS